MRENFVNKPIFLASPQKCSPHISIQPQRKSRSLYFGENDEILEEMSEGQTNKYFDLYDSISAQMIR